MLILLRLLETDLINEMRSVRGQSEGGNRGRKCVKTLLIDFPIQKRLNSPMVKQAQHSGKMQ